MPKSFKVGDTTYNFPDSMSDSDAQKIMSEQGILPKSDSRLPGERSLSEHMYAGKSGFPPGTKESEKGIIPTGQAARETIGMAGMALDPVAGVAGIATGAAGHALGLPEWANITAGLLAGGVAGAGQGFAKKLLGMRNEQRIEVLKQGMKFATKSKLGMFKDALNWITKHGKEAESEAPKEVRFKDFQQGKGEYGQTFPKPKPAPEPKAPEPFKPGQVTKRNMGNYPGPENKYQSPSYPKAGTGKPATPNGGVPLEKPPLGPPGGKFTPSSRTASLLNRAKGSVGAETERAYGGPSYRAARSAMPKPGQVAKGAEEAGETQVTNNELNPREARYQKRIGSKLDKARKDAMAKDDKTAAELTKVGVTKSKWKALSANEKNALIKKIHPTHRAYSTPEGMERFQEVEDLLPN